MTTPKWAQDYILEALLYLKSKGFESANNIPIINWRKPTNGYSKKRRDDSSGVCKSTSITICAGKDRIDCKLVILHELSHWILPLGIDKYGFMIHEGHTPRFWDIAWDLYRQFKLPIRYCQQREYTYKKQAKVAYARNRKVLTKH